MVGQFGFERVEHENLMVGGIRQSIAVHRTNETRRLRTIPLKLDDLKHDLEVKRRTGKRELDELLNRMRAASGYKEIVRLILLQHHPHCFDVIPGKTPVPLCLKIA